jgi:hypothetical protein
MSNGTSHNKLDGNDYIEKGDLERVTVLCRASTCKCQQNELYSSSATLPTLNWPETGPMYPIGLPFVRS